MSDTPGPRGTLLFKTENQVIAIVKIKVIRDNEIRTTLCRIKDSDALSIAATKYTQDPKNENP